MRPDVVPLVVVALLLVTAGQPAPDRVELALGGEQRLDGGDAPLIVVGGTVAVPPDARTARPLYVVGGTLDVSGTVRADVVQLAGNLTLADGAVVTGELRALGGRRDVAPGSSVGTVTSLPLPGDESPTGGWEAFAVQTGLLALAGFLLARRRPELLANVGATATDHAVVSVVAGALTSLTLLALFVFMAFTLVLLPVSLLGLLGGVAVVAYAVVCLGDRLGRWALPGRGPVATAAGVVAVSLGLRALQWVPVAGALVSLAVLVGGVGAVLITYFGLRRFEPPAL
ncbi:MAG: hypothetical protein ABEJ04_01060 [Halobacteriaceae archaeon]